MATFALALLYERRKEGKRVADPSGEGDGSLAAAVVKEADESFSIVFAADGVNKRIKAGFGHSQPLKLLEDAERQRTEEGF